MLPVLVTYLVCDPVFNLSTVVTNTLQLKEREKKELSILLNKMKEGLSTHIIDERRVKYSYNR